MDANQLKNFRKWVKFCQKQGLIAAKCGEFEFSASQKAKIPEKKGKLAQNEIEGLVHDPSAAMPNDSEMLYYSTQTFDSIRESRKDPVPR